MREAIVWVRKANVNSPIIYAIRNDIGVYHVKDNFFL